MLRRYAALALLGNVVFEVGNVQQDLLCRGAQTPQVQLLFAVVPDDMITFACAAAGTRKASSAGAMRSRRQFLPSDIPIPPPIGEV